MSKRIGSQVVDAITKDLKLGDLYVPLALPDWFQENQKSQACFHEQQARSFFKGQEEAQENLQKLNSQFA